MTSKEGSRQKGRATWDKRRVCQETGDLWERESRRVQDFGREGFCEPPQQQDGRMLARARQKGGGHRNLLCRARSGLSSGLPEAGRLFLCSGKETEERVKKKNVRIKEGLGTATEDNGIN